MSEQIFEAAADEEATAQAVAAAAPTAPERADQAMVNTLASNVREPMHQLLTNLADNKYVLGRRYAEWCTGAPMLESAVAAAAMAQDELGHARSFYPLLRGFNHGAESAAMEEKGWQARATNAVACLDRPFERWADFIAANLLLDTAFTTLLQSATDSPYQPLRQRAAKIVQEEAAHFVHASGWLRRLPDALPSLASMWDDAVTWFGQDDDPVLAPLAHAGLLGGTPATLREHFKTRLQPLLQDAAADQLAKRKLPWDRWDPSRRRLRG